MPTPTNDQVIIALYSAYFVRAPDQAGFDTWSSDVAAGTVTLEQMSQQFFDHPYSLEVLDYDGISNTQFILDIYANVLQGTGSNTPSDNEMAFWLNQLNTGMSRADMVHKFVTDSLSIDFPAAGFTDAENEAGALRQERLYNVITVSESYMNTLGADTNIPEDVLTNPDPAVLAADPAFQASQKIISGVTSDPLTQANAVEFIQNQAAGTDDPIATINDTPDDDIFGEGEDPNPGQTFTLTTAVDNFSLATQKATEGNDTYRGENSPAQTINTADNIDGAGGTDQALLNVVHGAVGGNTLSLNAQNVENWFIQGSSVGLTAGVDTATFNFANVTGAEQIWSNDTNMGNTAAADAGEDGLAFTNIQNAVTLGIKGGALGGDCGTTRMDDLTAQFASGIAGADKTLNVAMDGGKVSQLAVGNASGSEDFGTIAIDLTGSNGITDIKDGNGADTTTTKMVFTGTGSLSTGAELENVTEFDASAKEEGGVSVTIDDTKDVTFKGGKGNDGVNVGAVGLSASDNLDGGEGTDRFSISDSDEFTTANLANVKNFETLSVGSDGNNETYDVDNLIANNSLTGVSVGPGNAGVDIAVNDINDGALGNLSIGSTAAGNERGSVTFTAKSFVSGGTTDTATVKLGAGCSSEGVDIDALNFANVDVLNLVSSYYNEDTDHEIESLNTADIEKVVITGEADTLTVVTAANTGPTEVDASGLTDKGDAVGISWDQRADVGGGGLLFRGTTKNDTVFGNENGATEGDTFYMGAGSDNVTVDTGATQKRDSLIFTGESFGSGDLGIGDTNTVTGWQSTAEAGTSNNDIVDFSTAVEGILKIGGTLVKDLNATTAVGANFDNNNNVRAVDGDGTNGGAVGQRLLQVDVNGDGQYSANSDFQVVFAGKSGATVQYNATGDFFELTTAGGGGGGGGAAANNTLTAGADTFNNTVTPVVVSLGGADQSAGYVQDAAVTLYSSQANLQAGDTLTFGTGASTLRMVGATNSATFVSAANTIGGATVTGLDTLALDDVVNGVTVSGNYGTALTLAGGTQGDTINVDSLTTGGLTVNGNGGNDTIQVGVTGAAAITPTAAAPLVINTGDGNNTVNFFAVADLNDTDSTVNGGTGTDVLVLSTAGDVFTDASFANVTNFETARITGGANGDVQLGINAFGAGIRNIDVNGASTIESTYGALAAVNVIGTNVADNTAITFDNGTNGTVNVTDFVGDIAYNATVTAGVSVAVRGTATTAVAINETNHTGALTLTGGTAGQEATITARGDTAGISGSVTATNFIGNVNATFADLTQNAATLNAGTGNVTVIGGNAGDTITTTGLNTNAQTFTEGGASTGIMVVNAGAGAQTITVLAAGADSITGGAGNDTINLTGTGAADHVIFAGGTGTAGTVARVGTLGVDTITNFSGATDELDFAVADFGGAAGAVDTNQVIVVANTATDVNGNGLGGGAFSYAAQGFVVVGTNAAANNVDVYWYDGTKTSADPARTVAELIADGDMVQVATVGLIDAALTGNEFDWV